MDQQFGLGLDRLELVGLAFEGSPRSNKATHGGSPALISSGLDFPIQELSIATAFIPSLDEILLIGVKA